MCAMIKVYTLSAWNRYVRQALKDRTEASFRKICRWKLTGTADNSNGLLFDVDSKLYACSKSQVIASIKCYHCIMRVYSHIVLHP